VHVSSGIEAFLRIENSDLLASGGVVTNVKHGVDRVQDTTTSMKWGHNIRPVLDTVFLIHLFVYVVEVETEPVDS
jgi:hypothetical protein